MRLLTRDEFREKVFARDGHRCVVCHGPAADAHHIVERRLWGADGGYYLANGACLCEKHHIAAEQTILSCEQIREAAGIAVIALPSHFDRDERYDKWGNIYLSNGQRGRGELFDDESVQAILKAAGVLNQFAKYVKFPKIFHLPFSEGVDERTDKVFTPEELQASFVGEDIVVTEKMDGENISMYQDSLHGRSLNSPHQRYRDWVKAFHARLAHNIPESWRICGEYLRYEHSIHYRGLPAYFLVLAIYNEGNVCLSWEETFDYARVLGLDTVPVLYRGRYDETAVKACYTGRSRFGDSIQEGYVLRIDGRIRWNQHQRSIGKFVRKGHVQTTHGWRHGRKVLNELAKDARDQQDGGCGS